MCVNEAKKSLSKHPIWDHPKKARFFHYSYLFQAGRLVSVGMNRMGEAPVWYPDNAIVHSEVDAWRKAKNILDNSQSLEILNLRFNRFGDMRMSKPCPCCHTLLTEIGCKRMYFSTDVGIARMED